MKYFIIGDEDAVLGFGLVGIQGLKAENPAEAQVAFNTALEDKGVGIIIIEHKIADMIRSQVDKYIFTKQFPLIVEVPGRAGKDPGRLGLRAMVNEAIGIKL
ncbi:MAG: V-type ATP synthase subunit F [Spirochaetes bacterium]|nr:V-type ATP synthase subunit F [Spirochaetota bacterium]